MGALGLREQEGKEGRDGLLHTDGSSRNDTVTGGSGAGDNR